METPLDEAANGAETRSAREVPEDESLDLEQPLESADAQDYDYAVLEAAIARLDTRLEESQRLHARQSDLVDRLHAENQDLRAGELRNAQLPLIRDLLRLHDDIARMREASGDGDGDLRIVQECFVDLLARNGVEPFAPDRGEPFDPTVHAAAGTEPTADESLDKAVVEIVRRGFRWDSGDVIRVAEVRAYRYRDAPSDGPPEA